MIFRKIKPDFKPLGDYPQRHHHNTHTHLLMIEWTECTWEKLDLDF